MELQRHQDQGLPEKKGQRRKLEEEIKEETEISLLSSGDTRHALFCEVTAQVNVLNSTFSWHEADCAAAKRTTHVLAELAKNVLEFEAFGCNSCDSLAEEVVNIIIEGGAVSTQVRHPQVPSSSESDASPKPI